MTKYSFQAQSPKAIDYHPNWRGNYFRANEAKASFMTKYDFQAQRPRKKKSIITNYGTTFSVSASRSVSADALASIG